MTLLQGSSSADIAAGADRCWAVIEDVASWPLWQHGLERVEVIERDADGRPSVCDIVHDAKITKVRCRVKVSYEPERRVTFGRIASDDVDAMDGSWALEPLADGRTRGTYTLAVDPGPVGFMARPLERALRPLVVGRRGEELARAVAERG